MRAPRSSSRSSRMTALWRGGEKQGRPRLPEVSPELHSRRWNLGPRYSEGALSEPLKHHYLPEFYLSRWRNAQAKVIEFRFRFGKLEARPTSTKGTGYRPRLYSKSEGPDPHKIEKGFMKKLDTKASKVLDLFEAGVTPEQLSAAQRSDWSRFIMSLWMRTPADIQTMKECYCAEFGAPTAREEAKYRERRQPGWPETFAEALSQRPATRVQDDALDVAIRMMDHEGLGGILNNMIWYIIDVSASGERLLTSDRPVMFDLPLVQHDSYVFMPISPPESLRRRAQRRYAPTLPADERRLTGGGKQSDRSAASGRSRLRLRRDTIRLHRRAHQQGEATICVRTALPLEPEQTRWRREAIGTNVD